VVSVGFVGFVNSCAAKSCAAANGKTSPQTRPARKTPDGLLVHTIESPYQSGQTTLRVLLPRRVDPGRRYRVVYVLPVEARDGRRYGDGLAEIRKLGLHDKHGLICVYPTFSQTPWYADHPTDPNVRQESHLLKAVLPLVEARYPVLAEPRGRLLLGFSKSGWGAWSLLLRHPEVFGKAAAWDAPLTKDRPDQYGMRAIFATRENFLHYHVPSLLERVGPRLGPRPRLALLGYGGFREHHVATHASLLARKVPHLYRDGPKRRHHWAGGWVEQAVTFLAARADGGTAKPPRPSRQSPTERRPRSGN